MTSPDFRATLADTDYRRQAAEHLDAFTRLAPPDVVAVNVQHYRLSERAEAGEWFDVARISFYLLCDAEEYYDPARLP